MYVYMCVECVNVGAYLNFIAIIAFNLIMGRYANEK